jgi:hypothetical protein
MLKIIAITADNILFKQNRILNSDWCKRFPGTNWIPLLGNMLSKVNIIFVTSDVALSNVESGFWFAQDIGIIQHQLDIESEQLISLGAKPLLITSFESPAYTPDFFNNVFKIANKFKYRILWSGIYENVKFTKGINFNVHFPSYSENDLMINSIPWSKRNFLAIVLKNMYVNSYSNKLLLHPVDFILLLARLFKKYIIKLDFKNKKIVTNLPFEQLHDKRLSAIIFFGEKRCLKLFGRGWNNITNLPRFYQSKLKNILHYINPEECLSKISVLRNFKYSICFENASFKGGISEKIIDCFVAGVIPIYLGAKDINLFIPKKSFIDVRDFSNWTELYNYIISIDETEAKVMINEAKKFLKSESGKLHCHENFAYNIFKLIRSELMLTENF